MHAYQGCTEGQAQARRLLSVKTFESGQSLPYGLVRVTPAHRDSFARQFCLSLPICFRNRRGYDINSDLMIDGPWIGRALVTFETFHHAGFRVAFHFGWHPSAQARKWANDRARGAAQ